MASLGKQLTGGFTHGAHSSISYATTVEIGLTYLTSIIATTILMSQIFLTIQMLATIHVVTRKHTDLRFKLRLEVANLSSTTLTHSIRIAS